MIRSCMGSCTGINAECVSTYRPFSSRVGRPAQGPDPHCMITSPYHKRVQVSSSRSQHISKHVQALAGKIITWKLKEQLLSYGKLSRTFSEWRSGSEGPLLGIQPYTATPCTKGNLTCRSTSAQLQQNRVQPSHWRVKLGLPLRSSHLSHNITVVLHQVQTK